MKTIALAVYQVLYMQRVFLIDVLVPSLTGGELILLTSCMEVVVAHARGGAMGARFARWKAFEIQASRYVDKIGLVCSAAIDQKAMELSLRAVHYDHNKKI